MPGSIRESRLYNTTCVLLGVSSLFLHVGLVTTSLKDEFQVYLSWPWVLCTTAKAVQYDLLEGGSHFWILCFPGSMFGRMGSVNEAGVL